MLEALSRLKTTPKHTRTEPLKPRLHTEYELITGDDDDR